MHKDHIYHSIRAGIPGSIFSKKMVGLVSTVFPYITMFYDKDI